MTTPETSFSVLNIFFAAVCAVTKQARTLRLSIPSRCSSLTLGEVSACVVHQNIEHWKLTDQCADNSAIGHIAD